MPLRHKLRRKKGIKMNEVARKAIVSTLVLLSGFEIGEVAFNIWWCLMHYLRFGLVYIGKLSIGWGRVK